MPSSPCFTREDNQIPVRVLFNQLRVPSFFSPNCTYETRAIPIRRSRPRRSVPVKRGYNSGISTHRSSEAAHSPCHQILSSCVPGTHWQICVPEHHLVRHHRSRFRQHGRPSSLNGFGTALQSAENSACQPVIPVGVQPRVAPAALAAASSEQERKSEAPPESDLKQRRR